MEKGALLKERRAKEIISGIVSTAKSEADANKKLLASNNYEDENTVNRINKMIDDERIPKCQYLEDYYRQQDTYCYINCKFDLKPAIMHNIALGFPNRLDRKTEQVGVGNSAAELPQKVLQGRAAGRPVQRAAAGQHDPPHEQERVPAEPPGDYVRQIISGVRLHFVPEHISIHKAEVIK